jgi:membrane peptidoglycan carboxypeptidase
VSDYVPDNGGPTAADDGATWQGGRATRQADRKQPVHGWKRVRRITGKIAKWGLITGLVMAIALVTTIYVMYRRTTIPNPNKAFQANTSYIYYSDGKHKIGSFSLQNRQSIPLAKVPKRVQDAVISAENRTFWTDKGIDPKSIVRAALNDVHSNGDLQGASTITQQYVKVLYLTQQRTYKRKIRELFLAVKLENTLSKRQILEGYLNTIYFGRGAYGIQAAAQAYFGKNTTQLNAAQGAVLASVINAPSALDPAVRRSNRVALRGRYRYVIDGMAKMGSIDHVRARKIERRLPRLRKYVVTSDKVGQRGFMLELVERQLRAIGFSEEAIYGGGLKIVTTFSYHDQRAAIDSVNQVAPKRLKGLHVALTSIDPKTGALRAMYGGSRYPGINWALSGAQPGSAFKAFALAAGLKDGFTLYDTFNGSPFDLPNGEHIENEGENGGQSLGPITLLRATQNSVNTAYVDMTTRMKGDGPQNVRKALAAAGIPVHGIQPVANIALGTQVVPEIKMAEGYATFANNGVHNNWYVIQSVSDRSGTRYEHKGHPTRAFSEAVTSNVTYALQQVVNSGTGRNALGVGRPAAGKTGTATACSNPSCKVQHVSSSWFIGYTPQLVTAVMYVRGRGNEDLEGYLQPSFYGGTLPTLTWTAYMKAALEGAPVLSFDPPAHLTGTVKPTPTYTPPTSTPTPTPTTPTTPTTTAPTTSTLPTKPTKHTKPTKPTITPTGPPQGTG